MGLYERADLYDIFEDENRFHAYKRHWEAVLKGRDIHSMLDVSIGSGSATLPILDFGIELSGSDLSADMLKSCERKALERGHRLELKCSDFRDLSCWRNKKYDMVASTGNALPYVNNAEVCKTLEEMDSLVREGGYLYFDTRNWERMLRERTRFYVYNPLFDGENRVNVVQVWDYNTDDTITFNILYTFERNEKIFQREIFEERYYPVKRELLLDKLRELGYADIEVRCFPAYFEIAEFEQIEWYCVIAKKGREPGQN